jgi:hypothetical protein
MPEFIANRISSKRNVLFSDGVIASNGSEMIEAKEFIKSDAQEIITVIPSLL